MNRFLLTFTLFHFFTFSLYAEDCISRKVSPSVEISVPKWTKSVVPGDGMDILHGHVASSLTEQYSLSVLAEPVTGGPVPRSLGEGGYCIVLTGIDAIFGYTEFLVEIDSRHRPGSCGYDITLEHEEKHIDAHLSAAADAAGDIRRSIVAAANAAMPIFVESHDDIDAAMDRMQSAIQNHPDIILMKQKLDADQEIRNKKIDQREDSKKINKCLGL